MTRAMLHRVPKSANGFISKVTKKHRTTVPHKNYLSLEKDIEKMTFDPPWRENYSLIAE